MRNIDNITKTLRRPFAGAALCALALAGALSVTGCRKQGIPASKGDGVLFSASVSGSESGTKTAYDGTSPNQINWLSGDLIRIWSAECSEPAGMGQFGPSADYSVTVDADDNTKGKITVLPNTVGLRWGEPKTTHHFYAVYPSPLTKGKTSDTGEFLGSSFSFTGHIPSTQSISGDLTPTQTTESGKTVKTTIASPDMTNLYMVSKAEAKPESTSPDVFLEFTPLSTAIQFTIQNDMTAGNMQVESVKIMSDPRSESGETAKNLSGAFSTTLSNPWAIPSVSATVPGMNYTYSHDYPVCTDGTADMSPAVSINFTGTTANDPGIARGDRLQFTFFLLPTQSVDDLSFVIKRADGTTLKTRLAMADGTGIPFPKHKKTYVKGILVPDGAVWTISFDPKVTPWDNNKGGEADAEQIDPLTFTTELEEWKNVEESSPITMED